MNRDLNADERSREVEMLNSPNRWPRWPVLPMKRGWDQTPNIGFVTADYPHIILSEPPTPHGILLQLACEEQGMPILGKPNEVHHEPPDGEGRKMYEERVIRRYEDIDGMLDDGWRID